MLFSNLIKYLNSSPLGSAFCGCGTGEPQRNGYMGIQRIRIDTFRLGVVAVAFIMTTAVNPIFGAEDAVALLMRTLEVNRPWLNPSPAEGIYSLWRQSMGQVDEITGPFSLAGQATNGLQFAQPYRVGSIVWTPRNGL